MNKREREEWEAEHDRRLEDPNIRKDKMSNTFSLIRPSEVRVADDEGTMRRRNGDGCCGCGQWHSETYKTDPVWGSSHHHDTDDSNDDNGESKLIWGIFFFFRRCIRAMTHYTSNTQGLLLGLGFKRSVTALCGLTIDEATDQGSPRTGNRASCAECRRLNGKRD